MRVHFLKRTFLFEYLGCNTAELTVAGERLPAAADGRRRGTEETRSAQMPGLCARSPGLEFRACGTQVRSPRISKGLGEGKRALGDHLTGPASDLRSITVHLNSRVAASALPKESAFHLFPHVPHLTPPALWSDNGIPVPSLCRMRTFGLSPPLHTGNDRSWASSGPHPENPVLVLDPHTSGRAGPTLSWTCLPDLG